LTKRLINIPTNILQLVIFIIVHMTFIKLAQPIQHNWIKHKQTFIEIFGKLANLKRCGSVE